jgi:hypothetical protein
MKKVNLAFLVLIIVIIISILYIKREGYTNYNKQQTCNSDMNISFCPFGSKEHSFNGDKVCCDNDEFSEKLGCLNKTVCSLSSDGDDGCGAIYRKYIHQKALKLCPMNSKPNYYETGNGEAYCHAGPTNIDCTGPMSMTQEKCRIYNNEKDQSDPNSCYNLRLLDGLPCLTPGELCKKEMIPLPNGIPPLIAQTFMGSNKVAGVGLIKAPRGCYYDDSITNIMNKVAPPGWQKDFNYDDVPFICSTADKLFVKMTKDPKTVKYI